MKSELLSDRRWQLWYSLEEHQHKREGEPERLHMRPKSGIQPCRGNAKKTPGQRHQRDRVFQEKKYPNKSPLSKVVEISFKFSQKQVDKPDKIFSEK